MSDLTDRLERAASTVSCQTPLGALLHEAAEEIDLLETAQARLLKGSRDQADLVARVQGNLRVYQEAAAEPTVPATRESALIVAERVLRASGASLTDETAVTTLHAVEAAMAELATP